jgi:HK97 family phage prohead protease
MKTRDYTELERAGRIVRRALPGGAEIAVVEKSFAGCVRSINEQQRSVTVVASDETLDRYGDVVRVDGWELENYVKNSVVLINHQYDVQSIAGVASRTWVEGGKLLQTHVFDDPEWNPAAAMAWNRIKSGSLRTVSVGFQAKAWTKIKDENGDWTGGFNFTGQDLLETSWIPIPANPSASIAAHDETTEGARKSEPSLLSDPALIVPALARMRDLVHLHLLLARLER